MARHLRSSCMTSICSDVDEGARCPVARRLAAPRRRLSALDAMRDFLFTDIVADVSLPRLFEDPPDLADRVRGAWGRALERIASAGGPRLAGSPSAWAVFFGPPVGAPGLEPVRPYVVRVDRHGHAMRVTLRLFGFADCWLADAQTALHEALAGGIALRHRGRVRIRLPPERAMIGRQWGIEVDSAARRLKLRFEEPLVMRSGHYASGGLDRLPDGLERRLSALCRWQDIDVASASAGTRGEGFAVLSDSLRQCGWRRYSSNQTAGHPVRGLIGDAVLDGLNPWSSSLIQSATHLHAGSGCAFGLGRIAVLVLA